MSSKKPAAATVEVEAAPIERWAENFEKVGTDESELIEEVKIMEESSVWTPDIPSTSIRIGAIPTPIEAIIVAENLGLDSAITKENAEEGTKLYMDYGTDKFWNISNAARATLYETAKLSGSALGRMDCLNLAQVLNFGIEVARGTTLLLERQGKVMAMHSSGNGGYCIMPISSLLKIAKKNVGARFGTMDFKGYFTSNTYTSALWQLPDAQNDLVDAYQKAIEGTIGAKGRVINFMPAVRFSASDTARSSAVLQPMFKKPGGSYFTLTRGIAVKHEKSTRENQSYGLALFDEVSQDLFAKFTDSMAIVTKMANTEIRNPVNCLIGICNHLNRGMVAISRKYADRAREEVERYALNCPVMTMHDIYLSMSECISAAEEAQASRMTINNIEEAIAKVLKLHWTDFDVGGTVAWGERKGA